MSIVLNEEQRRVVQKLHEFYSSVEKQLFQLDAPAGTGKTTLIGVFLEELLQYREEEELKIVVCAYTNKAKRVLGRSRSFSNIINQIELLTIHQYFGSRQDYNEEGELEFTYTHKLKFGVDNTSSYNVDLVIIDEVSMVNEEQYHIFMSYLKKNGNLKIITLGDLCQLPPVEKNPKGKFVDKESLFYKHRIDETLELSMRNNNEHLTEVNSQLRECIKKKQLDMSVIKRYTNLDTIRVVNAYNYRKHFKDEFNNKKFIQFLSFKTKEEKSWLKNVDEFNTEIRKYLFNIKPTDNLDIRETEQLQVMKKFLGFNKADIISVKSVRYDTIKLDFEKFLEEHPPNRLDRYFDILVLNDFCLELENIKNHGSSITIQKLDIDKSIYNVSKITTEGSSLEIYNEYMRILKQFIKSFLVGIRNFPDYRNVRFHLWDIYHLYENMINAPIQTYYASSIYLSQGSTYDTCILNYKDFEWLQPSINPVKFMKLLYVGITRSSGLTYLVLK